MAYVVQFALYDQVAKADANLISEWVFLMQADQRGGPHGPQYRPMTQTQVYQQWTVVEQKATKQQAPEIQIQVQTKQEQRAKNQG